MDELKRCPFCGYKVVGFHDEDCFFTHMNYFELFGDEEEAIEAWNRREVSDD